MTAPETQMEIKPLEYIPMTAAETELLREQVMDLIDAMPRTAGPVITHGDRSLRYSRDAPNVVTLYIGENPNALHAFCLYAPDWLPFDNGKWSLPSGTGCYAEYANTRVFRKEATH